MNKSTGTSDLSGTNKSSEISDYSGINKSSANTDLSGATNSFISATAFEKNCGIALIVFTILLLFTMVMHPTGGNVEHLIRISKTIVITHAIAIFSLPFGWIGFWGLTRKTGTENFFSIFGFVMVSVGLIAVLLAATTNGIVLPIFLENYRDAGPDSTVLIKPVLQYSFAVNHAFDYIYTGFFCLAILCWSITILQTRSLPRWLAWIGMILVLFTILTIVAGIAVNSLQGLRLFMAGMIVWLLATGSALIRGSRI